MKNIMEANIIRIFSFNQREMQSGVFYRTGSVWDDGSFRYVPAWDIKAMIDRCMEIGADVKTIVNEKGKIHVMIYVG